MSRRRRAPMKTDVCQRAAFIDPQRDDIGHDGGEKCAECGPEQTSHQVRNSAENKDSEEEDEKEKIEADLQRDPQWIDAPRHGQAAAVRTRTPSGATRTGKTVAPSAAIAPATRSLAPRSTRKNTHPPPPAPQTLAPTAPARRVTSTNRSMRGVVLPGAFFFRFDHSSRSSRAASFQSPPSKAWRMPAAIAAMWSKLRNTLRSPSMWAFMTSQLLMPEFRGRPVYASTMRSFRSSRSTARALRTMPASPS